MKVEIETMLVVVTNHLTRAEMERLESDSGLMQSGYGVRLPLSLDWKARGLKSDGWKGVLRIAKKAKVDSILFDRDADALDGVPTYDW